MYAKKGTGFHAVGQQRNENSREREREREREERDWKEEVVNNT